MTNEYIIKSDVVIESGNVLIGTSQTGYTLPSSKGTNNQMLVVGDDGNLEFIDQEFILSLFIPGVGVDGSLLVQIVFTRDVDFDEGLPNSQAYANIEAH